MSKRFFFNDLEALRIAVDIEKRGEKFYTAAADKFGESGIKEMFLDLAQQERDHARTFERLYGEAISVKEKYDDTYLFEPEISAYLSAMVETAMFPSDEKLIETLSKVDKVEDVINLGIRAEKDSILFYTEMIIYSKLVEAKDAFRKLLGEEKQHLLDLMAKLKEVGGK